MTASDNIDRELVKVTSVMHFPELTEAELALVSGGHAKSGDAVATSVNTNMLLQD